ncbi:hypothetical protein KCP70_10895 [Salmonella enterica subsp. enterica]|nr:hypothetical protein KCP70_10895 [Salmonella enterica subsp. enterica]
MSNLRATVRAGGARGGAVCKYGIILGYEAPAFINTQVVSPLNLYTDQSRGGHSRPPALPGRRSPSCRRTRA